MGKRADRAAEKLEKALKAEVPARWRAKSSSKPPKAKKA